MPEDNVQAAGGQQAGGAEAMQEAAQGIMQAAEADMQAAEAIAQMGNKEAGAMLQQSAQLKMEALQAMGIGAPQQSGPARQGNPDTAGAGPARPVDELGNMGG